MRGGLGAGRAGCQQRYSLLPATVVGSRLRAQALRWRCTFRTVDAANLMRSRCTTRQKSDMARVRAVWALGPRASLHRIRLRIPERCADTIERLGEPFRRSTKGSGPPLWAQRADRRQRNAGRSISPRLPPCGRRGPVVVLANRSSPFRYNQSLKMKSPARRAGASR